MLGHLLLALYLFHDRVAAQSEYAAIPRWGQAAALVQSTLYVHGGRTDPYNSFSYTAAPVNNDLLSLSLASPFNPSSPPFEYVGGCSNCSSNQGPAIAWHTLTPLNTSSSLLFGGDPGPNSQVVLPDKADSSVLLDVSARDTPVWNFETEAWAGEPTRRIHHSAVSVGGKVWIVGGEKADGSGTAFAQHYVYDPSGPSFTQLPTTDAPGDITGHQAVSLADGRVLVLGGYSPSEKSLIPLSTIWILDTAKLSWSRLSVSTASVPSPRRAFAAAVLDSNRVLIHGGADAVLQTTLDDGWILDVSQSTSAWTNVSALTQLGPRRDHFAIGLGTMAIFGFGYAQNGPASASLAVFDAASGTFQSSYTPPTAITAPTATTLPIPTQTGAGSGSGGTGQPGSAEYPRPTGSQSPGSGNPSSGGNGDGDGNGNDNGDGNPSTSGNTSKSHATTIALSTVFGVLGLLVATTAASWYIRRRNSRDSFHRLGASDGEDSPHGDGPIPVAGAAGSHENGFAMPPVVLTVRDRLSRVVPGITPSRIHQERRDMLADEDTRDFETSNGWYYIQRNPSSGQSSWTSKRRPTLEKVYDSLVSLKSMGGAVLDYAAGAAVAGARSIKSREGSSTSRASLTWKEKQPSFDPYSDDFGLLNYASPPLQASRPRGGRQGSSYTYVDPFDDYDIESLKFSPDAAYHDDGDEEKGFLSLRDPPPRTKLQTMMHPATLDLTRLTPVSERTSVPTLSDPASSSETSLSNPTLPHSPFISSSNSSHDPLHSPRRPSSVIDANTPPSQPMQRSNSWWTRFAKTPILDRRSSSVSRSNRQLDFRDPNPPPRLIPIEESMHSQSPDSPESKHRSGSGGHQRYLTHHHGRSASSLGTAKTADSDVLERMGRTIQIIQKEGSTSSSQRSCPSRDVSGDATAGDEFGTVRARPLSIIESSDSSIGRDPTALVMSPTEMTGAEAGRSFAALASPPPMRPSLPERTSSGSSVAARVQAYERRMSQVLSPPTSPTRAKSPPPVPPRAYGLAPKQPLFVANPDHRHASSGDS